MPPLRGVKGTFDAWNWLSLEYIRPRDFRRFVSVRLRLQRPAGQGRAGQIRVVRGAQPVSAAGGSHPQPGQYRQGLRGSGANGPAGRDRSARQGGLDPGDPRHDQRSASAREVPGGAGRALRRLVALAGRDRELSAAQVRPELPRPAGAARGHGEPHHGRAQSLHSGGAGLQPDGAHLPQQSDRSDVRLQGQAELHGGERGGDLQAACRGFLGAAGCNPAAPTPAPPPASAAPQ